MSTVQDIIDRGFAKSAAARPETITVSEELFSVIYNDLLSVFQTLARENPFVLGTRAQVNFDGSGWPRPSNCLRVIKVLADSGTVVTPPLAIGDEINVVPFDDQRFCEGLASLTELGQAFVSTGQAMDPASGSVTVLYARTPTRPAALGDAIDSLFPSMFDPILEYGIAAYQATKDARAEDIASFDAIRAGLIEQLIEWSKGQTYSVQQRFPLVSPPLTSEASGRAQPRKDRD